MSVIGIILGSIFAVLAVLLVVTGALAWSAKLPGNPVIGLRVPEVRKSQELWDMAHRVAGPLWAMAGVCLAIAALISFTASGWMWVIPVVGVLAALGFLGSGAGMAAHTVARVDALRQAEEEASSDGCCSSGGSASEEPAEAPAPAPTAVDLDAVRRAAEANDAAGRTRPTA